MPRPAGRVRYIRDRNARAKTIGNGLDKPPTEPKEARDPNAWKKQHLTKKGVPKTRVSRSP